MTQLLAEIIYGSTQSEFIICKNKIQKVKQIFLEKLMYVKKITNIKIVNKN